MLRHCEHCGKDWTPARGGGIRWHDCPEAQEARRRKRIEAVRAWRKLHPDYRQQHSTAGVHNDSGQGPNRCQRCGKLTYNRYNCEDCWKEIMEGEEAVDHCLGQELGGEWL
jgi:hypothetical protein